MARPVYVVFVAGGSGTRMGTGTPKQFLDLAGRPVLLRTIERFQDAIPDMHVITVIPREHKEDWKALCRQYGFTSTQHLVTGGITRFHSVKNALALIPDGAIVAVQDGVRPFASAQLLSGMIARMQEGARALIPAVPVVDTLRSTDPALPAPDRSKLVAVQTPQCFLSEDIKAAYLQAFDVSFTDDASVVERYGVEVELFPGEKTNIKITSPEDLIIARGILDIHKENS